MSSSFNDMSTFNDSISSPMTPSSCMSENFTSNNETPTSNLYSSAQIQSKNLSFSDSSCTSPISYNYDTPDEITTFLCAFNSKYNVDAYSLKDVLQTFDIILHKERKNTTKTTTNIITQETTTKVDSGLKIELSELKSQIANIHHSNTVLSNANNALEEKIHSLESENKSIHDAIISQEALIEDQSNTIQSLSQQRTKLIEILHKQSAIIQKLELLSKSPQVKTIIKNVETTKTTKNNEIDEADDVYSLLSTVYRLVTDMKLNNQNEFQVIRDNSELKPNERIMLIIKKLIDQYQKQIEENRQNESKITKLNNEKLKLHDKCMEVLALFEEQLRFLQNLSHSNDLQAAVFYREKSGTSLYLTDCNKVELIRRCAALGAFIETTIGDITEQKFCESINLPNSINQTNIFNLLHPTQMQEMMQSIHDKINNPSDIDVRHIFDLLCAQIYMNDLLKNYAREISVIAAQKKREVESLQQQSDNSQIEKELALLQKRDKMMRKFIMKYVDVDGAEEIPTFALLKQFVAAAQQELMESQQRYNNFDSSSSSPSQRFYPSDAVSSSSRRSLSSNKSSSKQSSKQTQYQTQVEISRLQDQVSELNGQIEQATKDKESIQKLLDETMKKTEELKAEIIEKEKISNEQMSKKEAELNECQEKLKKSEEVCNTLTKRIEESEEIVLTIKKQRRSIRKTIENLQNENKALQNEITNLKQENSNITSKYSESTERLQKEVENSIHEAEALQSQNSQLLSQLQQQKATISKLSVDNKTLEMKVRAAEQKIQIKSTPQTLIDYQSLSEKVTNLSNENDKVFKMLSNLIIGIYTPNNLLEAAQYVSELVNKLKVSQLSASEALTQISNIRQTLGIEDNVDIIETINRIIQTDNQNRNNLVSDEKIMREAQLEIETIRKDLACAQKQLVNLKQWENWARRVYGIINENAKYKTCSNEIRLNLEEALLASVSHRSIFNKIDLLRLEKQTLVKFDRTLLISRAINRGLISVRPLIILSVALHKIQKMSGCITLAPTYQRPRNIDIDEQEYHEERKRPRLKKMRPTEKRTGGQPLIPFI